MKKILSLFLSALFIFGAFSINAHAQEPTKTDLWFENEKAFEFSADVTVYSEDTKDYSYTAFVKGQNICLKNVPFINYAKVNLIINGDNIYMCFSKFPFVYFQFDGEQLDLEELELRELMTFIGCYEKTINSNNYYVEEFLDDESITYKFCFSGEELKLIITEDEYTETYQEISYEPVNDSVFEPPFFSINITPLFKLIEKIFFNV